MVWVKGNPAARILANTLAGLLRDNNDALETALGRDHDFATSGTQTGDHDQVTLNDQAGDHAGTASHLTIYNDAGVLKFRNGTGTVRKITADEDVIVEAAIMFFYGNSAPTGWTIYSTVEDCLLAVKKTAGGGTYSTGGDGDEKGSWTPTGHTHTMDDVTLSAAQSGVPAHTHNIGTDKLSNDEEGSGKVTVGGSSTEGVAITIDASSAAAAASAHNHGPTASGAEANTDRPLAAVGVLATKDAY